jgi:PAS domain S-box-containing protein
MINRKTSDARGDYDDDPSPGISPHRQLWNVEKGWWPVISGVPLPAPPTNKNLQNPSGLDFLQGGGEMGTRIRELDWSGHPLGSPQMWPQSLKTAISLILNSRHPMWIGWGKEMSFLYNDAYLHVLGLAKHPTALGKPAFEVWSEIWDVCGPLADKVFRDGEATFVDDVRLFMRRGDFLEETYYSFSYSPIRDETGAVGGLFCPSNDVTPKVIGARRLRTLSELSSNALVEKTTEAACATAAATLARNPDDIPFALLYLIENARAHLKGIAGLYRFNEVVAPAEVDLATETSGSATWPIASVFHSGHARCVRIADLDSVPRGPADQPVSSAIVIPVISRIDGTTMGVLVAAISPVRPLDADYRTFFELIAGNIGTAIQNARAVEEEKRRADALAEIDRAKTAFFSNVSHEFRTPLTLMLGPLENLLAKRSSLAPEDREEIATAHRNSLRLLKLVNSLLDFSRIEAGRMKARFVPVDLASLTIDLASNFRSAIESAGLELVVECATLPQPVYVDREMWEKIVLNLLSNAFKFTFNGFIAVRLRTVAGNALLTVEDTGIGIPESELPRIFERFHRVEGAKGRTYEGTGIGLASIEELVKLHGGVVTVSSNLGKGSVFSVSLPFGSEHLPNEQLGTEAAPRETTIRAEAFVEEALSWLAEEQISDSAIQKHAEAGSRSDRHPRILLADDNADMREHVKRILSTHYDIVAVADGRTALEEVRREKPDLIISDVMMPQLDGFGLLRNLRADSATVDVPVILLSARAGEEARTDGMGIGADDYLVKPFSARELMTRVGAHLRLAKLRDDARSQSTRLLESITDGFLALNREWRFTYVNAEAERLNRIPRHELLGRSYWDVFPELVGAPAQVELMRVMDDRTPSEFENYYAPWKRWFYTRACPASDGGISLFFKDITERKRADEAVRLLGAIVDSSDDAIISKNLDGVVTSWNKGAERLFGYSPDEAIGRTIASLIVPDDRQEEDNNIFARLRAGERVDHFETVRCRKDGTLVDVSLTISPIRGPHGEISGASKIARDISYRKRAEETLRASEERFRALVTASSDVVYRMSADWTEMSYVLGREFVANTLEPSKSWLDKYIHPGDQPKVMRAIDEAIQSKSLFALEHRVIRADGQIGWTFSRAVPILDQRGEIVEWFGAASDITDLKVAEEALRRSEERFRQLAEVGPQIVWLSGPRGELEFINHRWTEFSGLDLEATKDPEQIVSRLHPEDDVLGWWQKCVDSGRPFELEGRLRGRDGEFRWFMMRSVPVKDEQGRVVRWFGTSTDIHQSKMLQLELAAANRDLEQFAYSASHDLQEPIRSVKLYSEILGMRYGDRLDQRGLEFLNYLHTGASRMEMLIRDLLAYTQSTQSARPAEPSDASAALQAAISNLAGAIAESGAKINFARLPVVRVQATQLQQLFQNLIGNAIKYHKPGIAPQVRISAQRESNQWLFSVSDNGIGIEPEYKERIFGLFKRLHTNDQYSGTGIGLALCQRIVERHHGRIWVQSEPGEGSTFYFTLPF